MSEIRIHIDRLILDGVELSSMDASAVQASLSAAVEQHLLSRLDQPHRTEVSGGAYALIRTPTIAAASEGPSIGERAGTALATTIAPLCVGPSGSGGGRG